MQTLFVSDSQIYLQNRINLGTTGSQKSPSHYSYTPIEVSFPRRSAAQHISNHVHLLRRQDVPLDVQHGQRRGRRRDHLPLPPGRQHRVGRVRGGSVVRGSLVAVVVATQGDSLDMRYHHVNREGQLMTGRCVSRPEVLPDGRLRMHETWRWTSGDESSGESVVEEVREE
ncbi:hypothetical protein ACCO45_012154 [Purpureocillium lilacinum]|uniref:Uncharacterized protein n=1 Tax=Purpureocillium lilacinum TaxID=33203 RepID=A0ACC4DDS4_PURLI